MPIEDICANLANIPADIRGAVRNNGGGHYNHSLFWTIMAPGKGANGSGGGEPSGPLADAIKKSFGSFADFKTKLADAGVKRFGSGWAWLIVDKSKNLVITSTPNQDNPLMKEAEMQGTPILGVDVWEHAYYLKYQNKRPDYLAAWWDVVNWPEVAARFAKAT
jgi:Fe-Mn family superoxide dismutase